MNEKPGLYKPGFLRIQGGCRGYAFRGTPRRAGSSCIRNGIEIARNQLGEDSFATPTICDDRIYLRPDARKQAATVIDLLQQLTEWLIHNPGHIGDGLAPAEGTDAITAAAVRYVSGMTDRFALNLAVEHLGWAPEKLPRSA